jgi:hypothetical protein
LDPFSWFISRDSCNAGDNVHSYIMNEANIRTKG